MRIGGYQINGISPRFWVLAAIPLLLVIVWFFFLRGGEDFRYESAVPLEGKVGVTATTLGNKKDWSEDFLSAQGGQAEQLTTPEEVDALTFPSEYTLLTKRPTIFRFKAYIPPDSAAQGGDGTEYRPDLNRTTTLDGRRWSLAPAVILNPSEKNSTEKIDEAKQAQEAQPVVLMTPTSEALPAGVHEITGMLFWHTDSDFFQSGSVVGGGAEGESFTSPIFLVDNYKTLNPAELRAPTTHTATLDLDYQEGPLAMSVKTVEWSANNEVRVCMAVKNTSRASQPNWLGATDPSQITASSSEGSSEQPGQYVRGEEGDSTGQTASPLSVDTLPGEQGAEDYIAFPAAVATPDKGLILRMPVLGADLLSQTDTNAEQLKIVILPKQIKEVLASDSVNTCGTGSVTASAAANAAPAPTGAPPVPAG